MSSAIISIVGNLGRAPELRYTPQGKSVCDYSVAVNTKKKDKDGEWQNITDWYKVTSWERQAENDSKYLEKGKQVAITGRLSTEKWTDRDGKIQVSMLIQPMHIEYIGGGGNGQDSEPAKQKENDLTAEEQAAGLGGW